MSNYDISAIKDALIETIYLLLTTSVFLTLIGLFIGFLLFFLNSKKTKINKTIYRIISITIDFFRSIPFIILMIILIPFTVIIVGTIIGPNAALPSLIISASPFYARVVYNALKEVPKETLEAFESMGANKKTMVKYLLKESLPSLINGLTIALVTLIGFIASAGAVGAGGLGDLARRRAFSGDYEVMYISVGLLLIIVFIIQITGDFISKKVDHR